jgi:hypothetical protein
MSSYAEQYTLYQIANAPLRLHPFPHILVREVFEPALYRAMLEHLLPPELMQPIKQVRSVGSEYSEQRFVFPLAPEPLGKLPPPYLGFWEGFAAWLLDLPLAYALLDKFAPFVRERFGAEPPVFYNESMLVDDRTQYSLGPHTDALNKLITLLFYLPADASRPHLGTSIYAPRDPAFRCPGGPHYPFEMFERVVTMPYVPNTLFAFFKTDNSFHGVEPLRDENVRRHLLFYDLKSDAFAPAGEKASAAEPVSGSATTVEFTF